MLLWQEKESGRDDNSPLIEHLYEKYGSSNEIIQGMICNTGAFHI
jgi:hypothetical protein